MDPLRVYKPAYTLIPMGWQIFSPLFYGVLRDELNIKYAYEILPSFIDNPKAFVLSRSYTTSRILDYIRETSGRACRVVEVENLAGEWNLYKITST
jgi:hypothetical protein